MTHFESGINFNPKEIVLGRLKTILRKEFREDPYHNIEHSSDVDIVSARVCEIIKDIDPSLVTEQEELAREVAAYAHDAVIEYVDAIGENNPMKGKRVRRRGFLRGDVSFDLRNSGMGNEHASSEKVKAMIDEVDPNHAIFKPVVVDEINAAIAATFPEFDLKAKVPDEKWYGIDPRARQYFDEEGKGLRIYQPYLHPKSSVATLSVALADLSGGGFMLPEDSLKKGNAEYRETRDRVGWLLMEKGLKNVSLEEKQKIIDDMKGWLKSQVQFFVWRKIETERVINEHIFNTSKENQQKIKAAFREVGIFKRFDEVIGEAVRRFEKYKAMGQGSSLVAENLDRQIAALAAELGY